MWFLGWGFTAGKIQCCVPLFLTRAPRWDRHPSTSKGQQIGYTLFENDVKINPQKPSRPSGLALGHPNSKLKLTKRG